MAASRSYNRGVRVSPGQARHFHVPGDNPGFPHTLLSRHLLRCFIEVKEPDQKPVFREKRLSHEAWGFFLRSKIRNEGDLCISVAEHYLGLGLLMKHSC